MEEVRGTHSPPRQSVNVAVVSCPKCKHLLAASFFNQPELAPCPACRAPLQVKVFPAMFRPIASGRGSEAVLVDGESSCFFHPQKKAVVPCELCGRFLCALCDCEVKGRHLCPACLESGQRKKSITGLETVRLLHRRQAFLLSLLPLFVTGLAAIYLALRYRKEPGSIVTPMNWAGNAALILGTLQTLGFVLLFFYGFR
jgi:hypothetical protein